MSLPVWPSAFIRFAVAMCSGDFLTHVESLLRNDELEASVCIGAFVAARMGDENYSL